jgi:oligo-1,6-glucosidase
MKWFHEAVGYQIYPKSFYDSNGDGIGDLNGIRQRLGYLQELGVTLLWLGPIYSSPMDDNGYDVSDFYNIAKEYGTMDDFRDLMREANDKGIRLVLDLVLNHTSDEHPWFIESRSNLDNPKREYYIWAKGKVVDGVEVEPTNWASFFGGSCWQKDETTGEYYMKIFSNRMPDLNWQSSAMREELYSMVRFWCDQGVSGFRVDAVAHLDRAPLVDSTMDSQSPFKPDWRQFSNRERVFDYLNELHDVVAPFDVLTVGEVGGGATLAEAIRYVGYDEHRLDMVFTFDHNWRNGGWNSLAEDYQPQIDLPRLKEDFARFQVGLYGKSWHALYWLNHDHPRVMSQYGNVAYHKESGKLLAATLYFMWGTPFLYNGEEIGMTNADFTSIDQFKDVAIKRRYEELQPHYSNERILRHFLVTSRDNSRTPMQWSNKPHGGFTSATPWIKVNDNHSWLNVEAQLADPDSILQFYKRLFQVRRTVLSTVLYGTFELIDSALFAYRRQGETTLLVISNLSDQPLPYEHPVSIQRVLLQNYPDLVDSTSLVLRAYETLVLELTND